MEQKRICEYCGTPVQSGETVCPDCKQALLVRARGYAVPKKHSALSIMALGCLIGGVATSGATAILGMILAIIDLVINDRDEKHTLSKVVLGISIAGAIILECVFLSLSR